MQGMILLLFDPNNHLILRARQATAQVSPRRFAHSRLTSRSLLLTLLTLASDILHAQSPPPRFCPLPTSGFKLVITF